ncbi:MAG: phospho-sugar mutase [Bacteroidales bacterium]|nr:phospho-sugar mutase [Bacteroidales bacterium]
MENKIQLWLTGLYDEETKKEIIRLQKEDPNELKEAFYRDLDFGTGGLRGIMGVGPNRMNKYTVGAATQGLANYLKKSFPDTKISVAIAYDSRINSQFFANITADVLSANNINVFLFDNLRPTPELSFAVRHLKCQSGIVITASHNPKEYNGYKVYWSDGGQLVPPHDKNVIAAVREVDDVKKINFNRNKELVFSIGDEIDEIYLNKIQQLALSPDKIKENANLPIVYTPLHGAGVNLVPRILKKIGFNNIIHVEEQDVIDGNFPTVKSPNPEERSALEMAISKAEKTNAELILATDPDADRVGVGVRDKNGKYILLNGNQTASLLSYYVLLRLKETNKLPQNPMMVKTIVTTELLSEIAKDFGVKMYNVLTGFKYIAEIIRLKENEEKFIGGGEESYGYLFADFVRDKDAVMSCCLIADMAAWAASQNKNLLDILDDIYSKYGYYAESLISITKKGINGQLEIENIMKNFRENPPKKIANSDVVIIKDYKLGKSHNVKENVSTEIDLPKSNVLQFILDDKSCITVRPSGTEPKIKFYFSAISSLKGSEGSTQVKERIKEIENDFKNV